MKFKEKLSHYLPHVENSAHFVYFGAAFFEYHHAYAVCAGVIAVLMIVSYLFHGE